MKNFFSRFSSYYAFIVYWKRSFFIETFIAARDMLIIMWFFHCNLARIKLTIAPHLSGTCLHSGWFQHSPRPSGRCTLGSVSSAGRLLWFDAASHRCHALARRNTMDAVITRDDAGRPDNILVVDVGLSDHHMLQWLVDTTRYETPVVADCSWRQL